MPPGLGRSLSFSNWILGGSLITLNKNEGRRYGSPRRVVLTEIDSDGNECDRHVMPLSKHKSKKGIKLTSDCKHDDSDSEIEMTKKNTIHKDKSARGPFCTNCGGVRRGYTAEETVIVDMKSNDATKDATKDAAKDEVTVEVKDTEANTGDSQPSVHVWTNDDDVIIKKMKGENMSWKDIAAVVGASKKEVQSYYKSLSTAPEFIEKPEQKVAGEKKTPNGLGIGELDFSRLFLDDDSGADGGVSGNDAPFSNFTGYEGYRGSDKKSKKDKKDKNDKKYTSKVEDNSSDWFEISPNGSIIGQQSKAAVPELREDGFWSVEDCELLEQLESNYSKTKWLHMQADFFNWTGRMVDASIIEKKFKDDGFN